MNMNKIKTNRHYFLYSTLSDELKHLYYKEIFRFTSKLIFEYPGFKSWYKSLFTPKYDLYAEREIIICEADYRIIAIAILKSNFEEKKICTFRVEKAYQRQGIGKEMMKLAFEWLECDSPIITLHRNKLEQFSKLLNYYNFHLEQTQRHYYNVFNTELVYNGVLPEKKLSLNPIEIIDVGNIYEKFILMGKLDINEYINSCLEYWYKKEQYRQYQLL